MGIKQFCCNHNYIEIERRVVFKNEIAHLDIPYHIKYETPKECLVVIIFECEKCQMGHEETFSAKFLTDNERYQFESWLRNQRQSRTCGTCGQPVYAK